MITSSDTRHLVCSILNKWIDFRKFNDTRKFNSRLVVVCKVTGYFHELRGITWLPRWTTRFS